MTITGKGDYTGETKAAYTIAKAGNPMTAKGKTATVRYKSLKKKSRTLAPSRAIKVRSSQGKMTYQKTSGNVNIRITSDGKIKLKKGLGKNTYTIKAKVTAAGNANYKPGTKHVTFRIVVQ